MPHSGLICRSTHLALRALVLLTAAMAPIDHAYAQRFISAWSLNPTVADAAQDAQGNLYSVGSFLVTRDFDPGPGTFNLTSNGGTDAFILKLDRVGNFVWAIGMGSSVGDVGTAVAIGADGYVHVVGYFRDTVDFDPGPGTFELTSGGGTDTFILKLDSDGGFVWARNLSGVFNNEPGDVAVDASGNVCTVGKYFIEADFDPGPSLFVLPVSGGFGADAFVSKLDVNGDFVWARRLGGPSSSDRATGVTVDTSGNVYWVGFFYETADSGPGPGVSILESEGGSDAFVAKLGSNSTEAWAHSLGGTQPDQAAAVTVDPSGNVYTVGEFRATVDFDPGMGTHNLTTVGVEDVFVWKLDGDGDFVLVRRLGGTNSEWAEDVALDTQGSIYTVGYFAGSPDFDPGPGVLNLPNAGSDDAYIWKLDGDADFVWARGVGGNSVDHPRSVMVDAPDSVYVAGSFRETADFDPGSGIFDLTAEASDDTFFLRLAPCDGFEDPGRYGTLLFAPLCARDASKLTEAEYSARSVSLTRGSDERLFLSSRGSMFEPLVVVDEIHVNGVDSGLGPYALWPWVPPLILEVPIEDSFVPLPAFELSEATIPQGQSEVLFELVDTQGDVYGNTAVYLVRDCGIWLEGGQTTEINWVTHDDQVADTAPEFDVRYGRLSELQEDGDFTRAQCLGHYTDTPATETLPAPPNGDGYYYLARGLSSCMSQGYGDSGLVPDPRDDLSALPECP